jgi:GMP synthase (glutamine-hydrolysing)
MKVLVIENSPKAPLGLFGEYLVARHGAKLTTVAPQDLPEAPGDEDLVVTLGSPNGVYEAAPWMLRQRAFLRRAIEADRPVVGICFGAQIIAAALGGSVAPFSRRFAGWIANAEVAGPVWRGPWVRWHGDHFTLPEGIEVLARDQGTIQAFQHRRAVAVQFHPEADEAILESWARATPDWLAENGLDLATVMADARVNVHGRAGAREALFDELLRRSLGRVPAELITEAS